MSAIGENALGGLIASEAHGVIGWVVSLIVKEIKLARGFKKEFEELKDQFGDLSRIIEGASRQRVDNSLMDDWLQKIKDAAEDVDNLLDKCSYKALQDKFQTRKRDKLKKILKKPRSRRGMARKVNNLKESIDSIYKHAQKLGIKPCKVAAAEGCSNGWTNSQDILDTRLQNQRRFVDERLILGRDNDEKELVKLICNPINSNSDLTVIGIVGMAGVGKTALIKRISKQQEVTKCFELEVIWLVVSHKFDLIDMLNAMVEQLSKDSSNMKNKEALILKLQEKLRGKKYLLVLDDVWDTTDWEFLKITLQEIGVSQGTTLLVTSRDKNVVEKLYTPKSPTIRELKGLSPGDSWSLFMAIYYDELVGGSEEEDIAKRMIDKCGGVPLAIRVLAGLLRGKSIEEWREIKESEIWTEEGKNDILPSLRLSYNYLPHIALKKCFAFCAIFEEDEVIYKHKLIYMWMAHGFLQPYDNNMEHTGSIKKNMEQTGEKYIKYLLSCSLFQEVERDEYGRIETFKMHDLVWTLARSVSMRECLCVCSENYAVTDEVRHLSIQRDIESRELASKSLTKLKTYLVGKYIWESDSLQFGLTCKHLRVLNVGSQAWEALNWKPLRSLIHLRYFAIDVNDYEEFEQSNLPRQITKLHHLQTLCINYIHLYDPPVALFLKKINNLVNLRHISIYHCIGIPIGLSHLTALQTLPIIKLGLNWGGNISDIGLFTNLRGKLEIHCLRLLTIVEARSMDLVSKSNLDNLVLKWGIGKENPKANEILEALQPHENLRKLELTGFDGTAFPKWLMGPDSPLINIVSLQIEWCREADGNLKLENFISLRILKVEVCSMLTVTFPSNKSKCCKSLEELEIVWCDKVEELPDLLLMPKLQAIKIWGNNSTSRDVLEGLGSLSHLKELDTDLKLPVDLGENSPVCKSLEKLRLDGSKYYNGDTATDLPEQLQHLVALQFLDIANFESVEAIPNWLGNLTSLDTLYLSDMPKLKQLPPQDVMQSLSNLTTLDCRFGCPILEEDFKNKSGEWFKISHIRDIWPK